MKLAVELIGGLVFAASVALVGLSVVFFVIYPIYLGCVSRVRYWRFRRGRG